MHRIHSFILILLCAFSVPATLAQGEEASAIGKVASKSASAIIITTDEKKNTSVTFVVDDKTVILRGRTTITIQAVESGEMARVVGIAKDGQKIATSITVLAKP